ncbi:hypothetical protein CEP52_000410 [Fusarium oligoseptatum]|uniref:Uncharacterized protein n=1 Tax=Fusarium oligoseptatum TaxID=2604345 RepID=A0A428UNM0_9HYPO|nr:hypothetical protein CEP52_000410 [Fusarium oligoseptatum]
MDVAGILHDMEIRQLAKDWYPELPYEEAYLKLHHDAFVKFPKELAKPVVAGVREDFATVVDAADAVYRGRYLEALSIFIRRVQKGCARDSNTGGSSQHSSQFNTGQPQDTPSAMSGKMGEGATKTVVREYHGIHVIGDSLVDHINYYGRWMQTFSAIQIAQGQQIIQALNVISDHLRDTNTITVSGAGGPDGFARAVYDLIQKKVDDIDEPERHMHRFFVYHPDTNCMAITLPAVGWGVNGACLALGLGVGAVTGLGMLAVVPVWFGTTIPAMEKSAPVIAETIYDILSEEAPRILGSTERVAMEE